MGRANWATTAIISERPNGAVFAVVSTLWWGMDILAAPGVGMSADAARMSACATSSPRNVCEKSGLTLETRFKSLAAARMPAGCRIGERPPNQPGADRMPALRVDRSTTPGGLRLVRG